MSSKKYKVLMTIDPTEPELKPSDASLSWFREWIGHKDAEVEVVFVAFKFSSSRTVTDFWFADYVKSLRLGKNVISKVLVESSSSRRKAVETLVHHAQKTEADLIVVSSHGRSGPERLVMGSFAESLLAISSVPLLFLSEGNPDRALSKKILFPTDLSNASQIALDLFLEQMKGYDGELVIYHAVSPPGAIFDTSVLAIPVYLPDSYWVEQKKWVDTETDQLLKKVTAKGFKVRIAVQDGILNTPAAIEKFAKDENVDLIAMASVSHGFDLLIMGSVAKGIFRLKKWPVWVCGPEIVQIKENRNEK